MKKAALFIVIVVVLGLVSFLPVWSWIYSGFEDRGRQGNFSQLSVTSVNGDYTVYVDNELVGKVADKKQNDFSKISPGRHTVKLVRDSGVQGFFYALERPLEFLPSSQVDISWEAGPTLESSAGTVKYFTSIVKPDGAEVYVLTFPQSATVEFDSKKSEANVFEIQDTKTHTIKVSNGSGFAAQTVDINLTDDGSKKLLTNLKLVVEVYLYKQPFK
jgi:hypothetical protein